MIELSLNGRQDRTEIMTRIKAITDKAMNGNLPIEDSFKLRFAELPIQKSIVTEVASRAKRTISQSLIKNRNFFREKNTFIVSNGFCEIIFPVADELGFAREKVFANQLL